MDCAGFHLNNINSKTIESWEQCKKEDRRQKRKVKKIFFLYIYNIMEQIHKTYKFRLYPNEKQEELLLKHFGCTRWVYNHFLCEHNEQYKNNEKTDNFYQQEKKLVELKKQEEYQWLNEVNAQSLLCSLRDLDNGFAGFFKQKKGYPTFKSRKDKNTFEVPQHFKIENGRIFIPKFLEGIKVKIDRKVKGDIKHMTITKSKTGKYYVSILTVQERKELPKTGKSVGLDLGIKDLVITSDGQKFENNKYINKYEKEIKHEQRYLSHKTKGSKRYENQVIKIAKIYEKISNCRNDTLHKISYQIVRDYDTICIEDLNVKGMVKNHKLAKQIEDAGWGNFVRMLQYKSDWYGKKVVRIDRFYPSSKTCHICGEKNENLKLSDREWTCEHCGTTHDRDINASINILNEGLRISGMVVPSTQMEAQTRHSFGNAQCL